MKSSRDVTIVSILDTCTSMLAGLIVFGVIGHLAHLTGATELNTVVRGGAGLAFITYPDVIAKFTFWPQFFAVAFFMMLFVLGIGSMLGLATTVMTMIRDRFTHLKPSLVAIGISVVGFSIGIMYTTPGGQFLLDFFDFYGASFVVLVLAVFEVVTFAWIYGVGRLCRDIEFMLGRKTGLYWRICWGIVTPILLIAILLYHIITYEAFTSGGYVFSSGMYGKLLISFKCRRELQESFLFNSIRMVRLRRGSPATSSLGHLRGNETKRGNLVGPDIELLQADTRLGS